MLKQTILAVDDKGNFNGEYVDKDLAHTGNGVHHLAITVFVYNSKGQILLQRRKHLVFDNIWENTSSTHQLHNSDGSDETDQQATIRSLKREYGIESVDNLENLGGFNYFAKDGIRCENEFCKLLIARYEGEVTLNEEVGYEYKWMDKNEFLLSIEKNPSDYTPWTVEAVKMLKQKGFFN